MILTLPQNLLLLIDISPFSIDIGLLNFRHFQLKSFFKSSYFQVKEMEERILSLKNELKRKKDEARKLLKDQQQKKKEALRQQELKLRKQIQVSCTSLRKLKYPKYLFSNNTLKGSKYASLTASR